MSTIYDRVVDLIKKKGMNGKQLSLALGLKKSPLTDWKNGKSSPTVDQVIRICEIFAISSDYLIFGSELRLDQDQSELLTNYNQLDHRGKYRVHTIIYEELDRINNAVRR